MENFHLRDLIGGFFIPVAGFLLILTWRLWVPVLRRWFSYFFVVRAGFREPVLAQQFQPEPRKPAETEPPAEPASTLHVMDDAALLKFLAELRTPEGEYRFSANKIRDIVGGADATIKTQVAAFRPKPKAPPVQASIRRPQNGW